MYVWLNVKDCMVISLFYDISTAWLTSPMLGLHQTELSETTSYFTGPDRSTLAMLATMLQSSLMKMALPAKIPLQRLQNHLFTNAGCFLLGIVLAWGLLQSLPILNQGDMLNLLKKVFRHDSSFIKLHILFSWKQNAYLNNLIQLLFFSWYAELIICTTYCN